MLWRSVLWRSGCWAASLGILAAGVAACSSGQSGNRSIGAGVHLIASSTPKGARAVLAHIKGPPTAGGLDQLSRSYLLTPSGPLPVLGTVSLPLEKRAPQNEAVLVATSESPDGPWTYIPAALSPDRRSVAFATGHFSWFTVIGYDLTDLASTFKSDFVDALDGGATSVGAPKPTCSGSAVAAAAGYSVKSSTTDTIYWCLDMSGPDAVISLTDNRRYPLEVAHPGFSVTKQGSSVWTLSRFVSGSYAILSANANMTLAAQLVPGADAAISTQMDGLGQSIYALQTGVEAMLAILTRFGAVPRAETEADQVVQNADTASKFLAIPRCASALGQGSGALVADCFSPSDVLQAFGTKGLLIAPIMAIAGVVNFFHSEMNALVDQFDNHDKYDIILSRTKDLATCTSTALMAAVDGYVAGHGLVSYQSAGVPTCRGGWAVMPAAPVQNGQAIGAANVIAQAVPTPDGGARWAVALIGEGYVCSQLPTGAVTALGAAADCITVQAPPPAPYGPFPGTWGGHTRGLTISSSGAAQESVNDGCCNTVIDVTYQLSNVQQRGVTWTATAAVTGVTLGNEWAGLGQPAPTAGQTFTLTLTAGVIVSSLLNTTYCDTSQQMAGTCGA